jgi:hypothetical protein
MNHLNLEATPESPPWRNTGIMPACRRLDPTVPYWAGGHLLNIGLFGVDSTFNSTAQVRDIRYTFRTDSESLLLYFDPEKLEKILLNLLGNAFKFTPEGGEIQLQLRKEEGAVTITVSDNGLGIPADQLPHIFDRFHLRLPQGKDHLREDEIAEIETQKPVDVTLIGTFPAIGKTTSAPATSPSFSGRIVAFPALIFMKSSPQKILPFVLA